MRVSVGMGWHCVALVAKVVACLQPLSARTLRENPKVACLKRIDSCIVMKNGDNKGRWGVPFKQESAKLHSS
jgi:hypothetical protein